MLDDSALLVERMRALRTARAGRTDAISDPLAALNVARFARWSRPFDAENARQAVLAFDGDVYDGLDARTLKPAALRWAQSHVAHPVGAVRRAAPARPDAALSARDGNALRHGPRVLDLYAFWGERIARALDKDLEGHRHPVLVNLASEEYFKAVDRSTLSAPVVRPVFQEWKGGQWKVISFAAKRARGLMTRYAVDLRIEDPRKLQAFDREGYAFAPSASDASTWYFRRRA